MHRLLSRTSITIDEAVSILLGRSTGPIDFEPIDVAEDAEANCPTFCLRETLEDELEVFAGAHDLAKHEKQSAHVIAEKFAALQHHEAILEQADVYRCAIADELNKGEQSMLKVDRALSNAAYTYITLYSFHKWMKYTGRQNSVGELSGVSVPAGSRLADPENATKPKARTKLREQEDAILAELQKQKFDPTSLPRTPSGQSGVKAAVRVALKGSPLFKASSTFDKAWERLRKERRIVDAV